jgi:hypothetical protein
MIKRYKSEHDLSIMEDDNFLKSFYKSDSISDFFHYNILDRKFSFSILGTDQIKNTYFKNYEEELKQLIRSNENDSPKISDLKISINEKKIPINSIPSLYIKTKEYEKL